jgi:hypothetical protein
MVALEEIDWSTAFDEEPGFEAWESRDGLGSFDWSMESEEEPAQLAMMATSPSSSTISEVCSKCSNSYQKMLKEYETERDNYRRARSKIAGYQLTLESMEAKIITHENNEVAWAKKYEQQNYQLKLSEWKLGCKVSELEKVTKERDKLLEKLAVWKESGLSHVSFVEKKRTTNIKTGLGYDSEVLSSRNQELNLSQETSTSDEEFISLDGNTSSDEKSPCSTPPEFKKNKSYNEVPPPPGSFQPPRTDVSSYGVDNLEFRKKLKGQSNPEPLGESVEAPRDDNKVSEYEKDFSKQAVLPKISQSTADHSALPTRNSFQNTAYQRKPFGNRFGMMGPKLCFVCYSPHHLIKDCDYYSEYLIKYPKTTSTTHKHIENKPRKNKPVWNYTNRVNHSNFSKDYRYPHQKRPFSKPTVPSQSTGQAVLPQSTVRKFPSQGTTSTDSSVRPKRFNSYKTRRPYNQRKAARTQNPTPKVTTK